MKSIRTVPGPSFVLEDDRVQIVPPSARWRFIHEHLRGAVSSTFMIGACSVAFVNGTAEYWFEWIPPVVALGLGLSVLGHTLRDIVKDLDPGHSRPLTIVGHGEATRHDLGKVTALPLGKITASTTHKTKASRKATSWSIVLKLHDGSKERHPLRSKQDLDDVVAMLCTAGMQVEHREYDKTADGE